MLEARGRCFNSINSPVSVIIPCYNCESTIKRAVMSIAVQTWKPIEVIIVNDCSTDRIDHILTEICANFEQGWIKVIKNKENFGPGGSRNIGWANATQPYIAFLDADDSWHPQKIEIQLDFMKKYPEIAITGHRWQVIKNNDENIKPSTKFFSLETVSISLWKLLLHNSLSTSTVMLKRDLPFRFNQIKKFSEDYLLWLMIISFKYKGIFISSELTYLHKDLYGDDGLSSQLWTMEKGEIDTYYKLWSIKKIPLILLFFLVPFSFTKYILRTIVSCSK